MSVDLDILPFMRMDDVGLSVIRAMDPNPALWVLPGLGEAQTVERFFYLYPAQMLQPQVGT